MAVKNGRLGAVYISTNQVSEVISFSYEETAEEIEVKAMQDTAKRYEAGLNDSSGEFACNYDEDDSTGQESISIGDTVTLSLRPEDGAPNQEYAGSVKITNISLSQDVDGVAARSYSFRGKLTAAAQV